MRAFNLGRLSITLQVAVDQRHITFCFQANTSRPDLPVQQMVRIHPSVTEAIANFQPPAGYVVLHPRSSETSMIFNYGVRVVEAPVPPATTIPPGAPAVWMCMASDSCRNKPDAFYPLSTGKTSRATKHLREVHLVLSEKTASENEKKRRRDEELERLRLSQLYRDNPTRVYVLLETLRIVFNNLPFRLAEYEESIAIRELVMKDSMKAPVNAKVVVHSIVELYASSKKAIVVLLKENHIGSGVFFSIVVDFWTSKAKSTKFLGLRIYFIDKNWSLKSILLGVRHFNPSYSERTGGIRAPFLRWVTELLNDFGLSRSDVFGATTDGGPDVKWMVQNGMQLNWEWCVPHLTNAATKRACGMVGKASTSKNPPMTNLLARIVKTVYQTKHVEVMGTLFEELCQMGNIDVEHAPQQLLDYKAHRFLGLTRVVRRILFLWDPLVAWYRERLAKADREGTAPPSAFPLAGEHENLTQLLSLLEPINLLNVRGQSDSANQVEVLLTLFNLRLSTLNAASVLRDYRSTKEKAMFFRPDQLTPLAVNTKALLQQAFQRSFFSRYTSRQKISKCSFVLEIQLFLHPNFKNLNILQKVILLCSTQEGQTRTTAEGNVARVKNAVTNKVRSLMRAVTSDAEEDTEEHLPPPPPPMIVSEDLMELFSDAATTIEAEQQEDLEESCVEEELQRWVAAPTTLRQVVTKDATHVESVLAYWKRQESANTFKLLARVAKIIYAMPVSSAQIERDFGVAGRMVTPERSSIAPHNVDMSIFLSCNREYVDVTQCDRIPADNLSSCIPTNVLVPMDPEGIENDEEMLDEYFSDASDTDEETEY